MQFGRLKRREFITLLGGAAAAWPLLARAQQPDRMRRIGVLMSSNMEPDLETSLAAFVQGLEQLGWAEGRNVRIETRWAGGDARQIRGYAAELAALAPDVILANGAAAMDRCWRRPAPFRSCSAVSLIRSALASSTAWRGRAVMPPAF